MGSLVSPAVLLTTVTDVKQVPTSALRPPKGSRGCLCVSSSSLFRLGSIVHAWFPFPPWPLPPAALSSINSVKFIL